MKESVFPMVYINGRKVQSRSINIKKAMKYKKGDYVEYMTRQPEVHVQEMFGYGQVPLDDIKEEKHVGRIKTVIGDGEAYLIISLQPLPGFYCVENCDKIIRRLDDNEVTRKMRDYEDSPLYMAPNVYVNEESVDGSTEEKCVKIARKVVNMLFPEEDIEIVGFKRSFFLKDDIVGLLDGIMEDFGLKRSKRSYEELLEMKKEIVEIIRKKRFKEYYQVDVGVKLTEDDDPELTAMLETMGFHSVPGCFGATNYLVAIDTHFEEVSVMRNIDERSCFFRSLGPEFDHVENMMERFRNAIYGIEDE